MYVVEVGDIEVFVTLVTKGSRSRGTEPVFNLEVGLDWEGEVVPLCAEDRASVAAYVCGAYPHEVYHG
jgi:hypothetical protein